MPIYLDSKFLEGNYCIMGFFGVRGLWSSNFGIISIGSDHAENNTTLKGLVHNFGIFFFLHF